MISTVEKADYSRFKIPKHPRAQDIIPIKKMYESGMRKLEGGRYAVTYEIKDIDYSSLNDDGREEIFDRYSKILNSFDGSKSVYKLTICNRHVNKKDVLRNSLLPTDVCDGHDNLRLAYNKLRYDDIQGEKGYIQNKYLTISTYKPKEQKAEAYFTRTADDLNKKFLMFDSGLKILGAEAFGEIIFDFVRSGHESEYNYTFNEKDRNFRDYFAPDMIKIHKNYFEVGDKFGRCMMLKNLGGSINDDFLTRLAELKTNLVLSLDIIPVSNAEARKLIDRKDDDVEVNADAWSNKRKIKEGSAIRIPRQVKRDRKVIDEYIEDMDENNQKMFLNQITIAFLADSLEELQDFTESIYETAAESSSEMSILYHQQLQGLQTALPFGVRRIQNLRDCNTDTTAILMPFDQVKLDHNTGIPYGRHEGTKQQQMVDVRKLMNGHTWVFGKSGSGKSMNVKQKTVYEALLTDGDIMIIDVDGECRPFVEQLGGQIIHVGRDNINVADIVVDFGDEKEPLDPVKDGSNNVLTFIETILKDKAAFGEIEKSLVDRALRILYKSVINHDTPYITLEDVYDVLTASDVPEAQKLALAIERHVIGSYNCFAKPTNVDINSRIVCYDLSTLDKQLRDAGMLVVMNHIERRLIKNRKIGRATYIKMEELDYLLSHHDTLIRLKEFFERARKYGGFITAIIQNITRVLQISEAYTMLLNAETVIMHKQDRDDALELARMYGLSSIQVKTLQFAEPGHGINKIGDVVYAFDCTIPADNELYKYINTDLKSA